MPPKKRPVSLNAYEPPQVAARADNLARRVEELSKRVDSLEGGARAPCAPVEQSFPIFVRVIEQLFTVPVTKVMTILQLKQLLEAQYHQPIPARQRLVFAGSQLSNDKTVDQCGITFESCLHLINWQGTLQEPAAGETFQVFVRNLGGHNEILRVTRNLTVLEVKEMIASLPGTPPPGEQRLILSGQQLNDAKTLADCGVLPECTLHLIARLRGD